MARTKRRIPASLGPWLDPKMTRDKPRNRDGSVVSYGADESAVLREEGLWFGEPETTAVEEAFGAVRRAERQISRSQDRRRQALQEREGALANFAVLVRSLERFQETGEIDDRLYPTFDRAIKRELRKDQKKASKALQKSLPTALYLGIRHNDFRLHKIRVDQHNEYFTVSRRRTNPLTEGQLRQRALEQVVQLMNPASGGPGDQRLARALAAAKANIDRFWPAPEKIEPDLDPTAETREALLDVVGDLVVGPSDDGGGASDGSDE